MARRVIKRGAFLGLVLVGLVLLTAQKSVTSGAESGLSKLLQALQPKSATAAASDRARPDEASSGSRYFSAQYEYCRLDADGRPIVVHRRRRVFTLPEAPPEENDRTFIESGECQ